MPVLADLQELTYNSSVRTQGVVQKTCWKRWMIGVNGKRESGKFVFTTWTLTKRLEKKLDGNYTRMLRAILNKSWRQHPTRRQLYGHLPPITKTIQVRRARHAGHCWRSKDELVSDVLLWTPTYGQAKAGRPARTYIQQLCEDTGCNQEDLPEVMNDREKWREMVKDIRLDDDDECDMMRIIIMMMMIAFLSTAWRI